MGFQSDMVAQACYLKSWNAEAGGSKVPVQPSYIVRLCLKEKKISEMSFSIISIYE